MPMTKLKIYANYKLNSGEELATVGKVIFNGPATNGNVTLSESRNNFTYIDIIIAFGDANGDRKVVRVYKNQDTDGFQNAFNLYDNLMNIYYRRYTVNDKTITVVQSYMWASSGYVGAYNGHYIVKVIGYK